MTIKTQILSEKILFTGNIQTIVVNKFYDLDGYYIDEGSETKTYKTSVQVEIRERKIKYIWEHSEPDIFSEWQIFVDGKLLDVDGEVCGYEINRTKLTLQSCTGAG